MEPNWYTSIAGIAGTTVVIVQALKAWLSGTDNPLAKLPTALFVVLVAAAGTWFAHGVLGALEGELARLLTDAITAALIASGGFEMVRSAGKRIGSAGLAVFLAVAMAASMACSVSMKQRVVTAYKGTQVALVAIHNSERDVFQAKAIPSLTPNRQDQILAILDEAFAAQERAGAALLVWEPGAPIPTEISAWLTAADGLLPKIRAVAPELATRLAAAEDIIRWARAIVQIAELLQVTPPRNVVALTQ